MDIFIENIIKQKKTLPRFLISMAIVFVAMILIVLSIPFLSTAFGSIVLLIDAGFCYGAWFAVTSFNIEYEYCVTNGDVDIDKIMNKRRRKKTVSFKIKDIEIMAPVGCTNYSAEENGTFARVIDASTKDANDNPYYTICNIKGERVKIIFNPSPKMLEAFKPFAPRKIIEK